MRGFGKGYAVASLGIFLPSCGIYDAIWGNEVNQKRVAAQYAPASLKRGDEASRAAVARKLAVRVYATPRYAKETLDWQQQFARVVGDANPTLRTDLGIELGIVEYRTWSDGGSESSLPELMGRLETFDPGHDVEWVIALATAVPQLAESPDQLGLADTPGKHLVLRAMSDPQEFDAIERAFPDLSGSERQKLYVSRKRHKSAIVLLHEIGHTLGLPHETALDALMNEKYSSRASDFSPEAIRLAKAELARRQAEKAPAAATAAKGPPNDAGAAPPSVNDAELEGLSSDEQRLFRAAVAQKDANHLADAWRIATPLFARHPSVHTVQKLRCDLATAIGGAWENIRKECEPFMKLSAPAR